ncbi:histone-lysine N-methyltransferase ash1 [Chaetomidium leptoderma]|uniref:Histone-lysine N-methyltransferase ash1 n=1 Tax=Chaetomidium leptoderma TaxID=669021 RepID=A0AAN6VIB7_9PEZI|nr:histone-lysine N-methyltransferase ash1 [Chaetomidium leptoderma]
MAPIKPHWVQPSHPAVQDVIVNEAEFTTKSICKVAIPPFGLFAKLEFPPCTVAPEPTYATVQMGRDRHLDLNSDLLYINHSCEPSLFFDTANMNVIAGPKGLQPGDELTFFYPSTEWYMAQPFDCLCGTPTCRGRIAGARDMTLTQLNGLWLNGHIHELLEEREKGEKKKKQTTTNGTSTVTAASNANGGVKASGNGVTANGTTTNGHITDQTALALALRDALSQAEKTVEAARRALDSYVDDTASAHAPSGAQRRGPTSRELSGEMGGDTSVHV